MVVFAASLPDVSDLDRLKVGILLTGICFVALWTTSGVAVDYGTVGYSSWLTPNLCLSLFAIRLAVVSVLVEFDMFMNEFTA